MSRTSYRTERLDATDGAAVGLVAAAAFLHPFEVDPADGAVGHDLTVQHGVLPVQPGARTVARLANSLVKPMPLRLISAAVPSEGEAHAGAVASQLRTRTVRAVLAHVAAIPETGADLDPLVQPATG